MSNQNYNYINIKQALSKARMSTYENNSDTLENAFILYQKNFDISGSFLPVLHICEVVIRNGVSDALEQLYGKNWAWSTSFLQSLPNPKKGYNPTTDLKNASSGKKHIGDVIADLKFVFWQKMFTRRHDSRLWDKYLDDIFPNINGFSTIKEKRGYLHNELESIRNLRNRIAHHEPIIFHRNLKDDYNSIINIIRFRCLETYSWVEKTQKITNQLKIENDVITTTKESSIVFRNLRASYLNKKYKRSLKHKKPFVF